MKHLISIALLILPISSALAQQPTPSQLAVDITINAGVLAQKLDQSAIAIQSANQTIEAQQKQIADLQKQLEDAKAAAIKDK
jgi:hypothetical protein